MQIDSFALAHSLIDPSFSPILFSPLLSYPILSSPILSYPVFLSKHPHSIRLDLSLDSTSIHWLVDMMMFIYTWMNE